jgi:biopolymer transport protein ExbD
MQFTTRKRRPPTVIIVSLIDVLIVVLIFLMVSTTFKHQPALKLALAESKEAKADGASDDESVIVAVPKSGPINLDNLPVTYDTLVKRLKERVSAHPHLKLIIRADADAPWRQVVAARDAAKEAKVETVSADVNQAKSAP